MSSAIKLSGITSLQGASRISFGSTQDYDFEDAILDADFKTEQGAFHLWAIYQSKICRSVVRELVGHTKQSLPKKHSHVIWRDLGLVSETNKECKHIFHKELLPVGEACLPTTPTPPEWIKSQEEILSRLESDQTSYDEFETALLVSEITDFEDDKIERLLKALGAYIGENRFVTDEDEIVMLSCAIRKYALNMESRQVEEYIRWLAMGDTLAIDNRIELELVKGILWRLSYEPFDGAGHYPNTIATLQEIADVYLNPRLIFQKSNVSTAAMAVAALFVLHGMSDDEASIAGLMEKVKKLDRDWIAELVEDDIAEANDAIAEYDSPLGEKLSTYFKNAKTNLF